jgi:hypothetical protein
MFRAPWRNSAQQTRKAKMFVVTVGKGVTIINCWFHHEIKNLDVIESSECVTVIIKGSFPTLDCVLAKSL